MKLLVTGASGMLAREIARQWCERHTLVALSHADLDVARLDDVRRVVGEHAPDAIVNCAAYNRVDDAETHVADAYRANALGPRNLAIAAEDIGATLVHFSTDFVFDGKTRRPYVEYDPIGPAGVYARSKAAGEQAVQEQTARFLIVRVAWLIGHGGNNFVETMLRLGAARPELTVVHDQIGTPTFCADVGRALEPLVAGRQYGLWHMTGQGECSWFEFATEILRQAGIGTPVRPITTAELNRPAPRPAYSALRNLMLELTTGDPMPPWRESLAAYLAGGS